jgi:hypothetical protein
MSVTCYRPDFVDVRVRHLIGRYGEKHAAAAKVVAIVESRQWLNCNGGYVPSSL